MPPPVTGVRGQHPSLRKRFSSIEPRTPTSPHPPNGHDNSYHIYTLPDTAHDDDDVFADEKDVPKENNNDILDATIVPPPPTPGTAPEHHPAHMGGWSRKRLRVRDAILIAVGVLLFLGIAVGTALAIILVGSKDSTPSSSPLSSSTTTAKVPVPAVVQYTGHLSLSIPWDKSPDELEDIFTSDLKRIIERSKLKESYIGSSLLYLRDGNSLVYFTLDFKQDMLTDALRPAVNSSQSLTQAVQDVLREQVVSNADSVTLAIRAESIVILEDIPVSTPSSTTSSSTSTPSISSPTTSISSSSSSSSLSPTSSSSSSIAPTTPPTSSTPSTSSSLPSTPSTSSSTRSTVSSSTLSTSSSTESSTQPTTSVATAECLPLTFEPCQVGGRGATFHLPNLLGHTSPLQAERAYQDFLQSPVEDASCSNLLAPFLCALLFPPCEDGTDTPIHPCDIFCKVVNDQCGSLTALPLDCQAYPTERCAAPPITTTTSTTTSTTSTTDTTTTTTTHNPTPDLTCVRYDLPVCNDMGFTETPLPSIYQVCDTDTQCLINMFNHFAADSIASGCTEDFSFFCANTFPTCDKEYGNFPIFPCRETCEDAVYKCSKFMPYPPDCTYFPSMNDTREPCIKPLPTPPPTPSTPTPLPNICVDQTFPYCMEEGFLNTYQKSWFADSIDKGVAAFSKWAQPTIDSDCSSLSKFFYCGIFFPKCTVGRDPGLPCKKYCEELMAQCPDALFRLDCSVLEDDDYCIHPEHSRNLTPSTTPETTTASTTTPITTTPKLECQALEFSFCSGFGYSKTSFPNFWADGNSNEAIETYYKYAEPAVSSGCTENVLFYVCSVLFPFCEGPEAKHKLPCRSYCEEVNQNCSVLFEQDCDMLSDPNPSTCLAPPRRNDCQPNQFACRNINHCVPASAKCNQINDCGDWSDERDCDCDKSEFLARCGMGLCILTHRICDGNFDCPDNSDEVGCEDKCKMNQYKCEDGVTCVMNEWVCDGQQDCPDNDDETYCHECSQYEFTCTSSRQCIPMAQVCDGIPQCPDHTDENQCIYKSSPGSPFLVNLWGATFYEPFESVMVCAHGFDDSVGEITCLKMGELGLKSWKSVENPNYYLFLELSPNGPDSSIIGKGRQVQNCPGGGRIATVECIPKECGHPAENLPSAIINGIDALPGSWPWMVSFQHYGVHKCGGAIIHPYFVLTAGHCVDSFVDYETLNVVAGTSKLSELGVNGRRHDVRQVIVHPEFVYGQLNDVALLELKQPLVYGDYIKPLCYPSPSDGFSRASACYIAGWGHTVGTGGHPSEHLQETKLSLWDTEKCNSSYMWDGLLKENEICAGYFNGLIAPCLGDSGSAVVCRDEFGTWKSVGVASYVFKTCNVPTKPMVFASTLPYLDWIQSHTECQFTCDNGLCLFDRAMLCNAVDDCGDKSDEINLCDISANCSFTDHFMCGYLSKWKLVSHGSVLNRFPLFDHSVGGHPGKFLLGETRGVDIYTPRIDLTSPHCMRFHYHMRGRVKQGMAVSVHEIDLKYWVDKWSIEKTTGPDIWLMGMFDLDPGHYDMVFRPHDDERFSLDDMFLLQGTCSQMGCLKGEFMCQTNGTKNCLLEAVRCNLVLDCDDGLDEKDCAAPAYTCDFENGNVCGLQQASDDSKDEEWVLVNGTDTPNNLLDHTSNDHSGTLLKITTPYLLQRDEVNMFQNIQLGDREHCLKFFYASTSPATLQITLEKADTLQLLLKFTDRRSPTWIPVQVTLPAFDEGQTGRLTYTVIGGELGAETVEQAIMIDDITITAGQCPPFNCPTGFARCEREAYCLPVARFCDRIIDCRYETDEKNCDCYDTEFKCPDSSCIPLEETCDLVRDCPDGSDEGAVCDGQRSVSCDFEHPFLCGYTVNTSSRAYHWERRSGKTPNAMSGPSSDHTFVGSSSLLGFYVVADSQKEGDFTSLESSPFESVGSGLVFFYHAEHLLHQFWMTGRLTVVVNHIISGQQEELWSAVPGADEDVWKLQCLPLPAGTITISFVVQHGSGYSADIALDDILLLDTSCDDFLTDGRLGAGIGSLTKPADTVPDSGCPAGEMPCRNHMCLKGDLFCDGVPDCPDGHDEVGCS